MRACGIATAAGAAGAAGRRRLRSGVRPRGLFQVADQRPHRHHVALAMQHLHHDAGDRRGDVHRGLVALDLHQALVLGGPLAFALQPLADLDFLNRFPNSGNLEFVFHSFSVIVPP